jgi:hypothetical protein
MTSDNLRGSKTAAKELPEPTDLELKILLRRAYLIHSELRAMVENPEDGLGYYEPGGTISSKDLRRK